MKAINKTITVILLLLSLSWGGFSYGQEATTDSLLNADITPSIVLSYLNTSNDSATLSASLSVRRESGSFALENAEVVFIANADALKLDLGKVKTDYSGNAVLKVSLKQMPVDKEGKTTFTVTFAGKGKYQETSETVTFKQAKLFLTFTQDDSIKTIHVKGYQIEANKETKPISGETVNIYVPRMLSNLKIGEISLDENGTGSIEYPGTLVGDSLGKLIFYAMIEESENFGTLRGEANIAWGIPKQYYTAEKPTRELWTPVAPVWMIITLIIMLTGVWAHYVYAVVQLVMIKKHSKKPKNYYS